MHTKVFKNEMHDAWEFNLKYVRRKCDWGYDEDSAESEKQQPVR